MLEMHSFYLSKKTWNPVKSLHISRMWNEQKGKMEEKRLQYHDAKWKMGSSSTAQADNMHNSCVLHIHMQHRQTDRHVDAWINDSKCWRFLWSALSPVHVHVCLVFSVLPDSYNPGIFVRWILPGNLKNVKEFTSRSKSILLGHSCMLARSKRLQFTVLRWFS